MAHTLMELQLSQDHEKVRSAKKAKRATETISLLRFRGFVLLASPHHGLLCHTLLVAVNNKFARQ